MSEMKEYYSQTRSGSPLALHFCGWEQCASGHSFGPAVRGHFLFHFVLSGKGVFERAGQRYTVSAGQGFLIVPGELTRYTADEADPWRYCWFGFDGTEADRILADCGLSAQCPIYTDHSGRLGEEMMRLIDLYAGGAGNEYHLLGRLYLCFSLMTMNTAQKRPNAQEHLQRALEFIHSNFSYEIGVAEIARAVGLDRTYLYRIFRRWNNTSPKEYLTLYRLQTAGKMLRDTTLSVTEIALSCGFKEVSLFDKQFKALYGASPLKFRREHQQG